MYSGTNSKKYIVIHETDNTSKGADAQAHANLQSNGNSRTAGWHYQVDDTIIIQSFLDNDQPFHAGNPFYNRNGIGIEIAVNSDGNYLKAVQNAIELTKHLMKKYNIPVKNVIRHHDASGKHCPRNLMNGNRGINWAGFKSNLTQSAPSKKPTTNKSIQSIAKEVIAGKWGNGNSRIRRLKQAGYNPNTVQAEVNKQLNVKSTPKKSVQTLAKEVIDGKWGNGSERTRRLNKAGYNASAVQAEVNKQLKVKSVPKVAVGRTVRTKALFATSQSTKNVRTTPISGYVDRINNGWRNPIRLKSSKNGHYIGFTRQQDLL